MSKAKNWITWAGGEECPVEVGTLVEVSNRVGFILRTDNPHRLKWSNIAKYRVLKTLSEK